MSPDPPREDSGDDENRIRRFSGEFMEGVMNDDEFFIVPDAPYEMDMDEESEYSDSDEDRSNSGAGAATSRHLSSRETQQTVEMVHGPEEEFLFQGQARGRYRLLIPFPNPTTTVDESISDATGGACSDVQTTIRNNQSRGSSGLEANEAPSEASITNPVSDEDSCDKASSVSGQSDGSKREIEMSEEKVEKIKEVMKNITLCPASIPKWVSEIDEDAWRKKLNDSINSKSPKPEKK